MIKLLEILKKREKDVKIIGPHTILVDGLEQYGNVFKGEPEGYMFDLKTKRDFDFNSIGKIRINQPENYYFPLLGKGTMSIEAIRGCPVGCSFCFQGMYSKRKKDVPKLIEEIKADIRYGYRKFFFIDLNFTTSTPYISEFCKMVKDLNIEWVCNATFLSLKNCDLKLMAEAGCKVVMVGVENKNQRGLLMKNYSHEYMEDIIRKLHKNNIRVHGYFILGSPDESEDDVNGTIDYALKLELDYATFQPFYPIKHTKAFEELKDRLGNKNRFGMYDFYDLEIDRKWLLKKQRKAYLKFYFRPEYIVRHLYLLRDPFMIYKNIGTILRSIGQ